MRIFNARAQGMGLPRVRKLTKARRTRLNARLNDLGGIAGWNTLLDRVAESPFLLGQGARGWRADFDFLIREKSCTKIMEGSYATTTQSSQTTQERNPRAGVKTRLGPSETPAETRVRTDVKKSSRETETEALADMRAMLAPEQKAQ